MVYVTSAVVGEVTVTAETATDAILPMGEAACASSSFVYC
jgi:hypothetical protein